MNTKFAKKVNGIGAVQGDVPILRIDKLPENARPRKSNVIALGEATGHHHVIEGALMYEDDLGNLFALVGKPARIVHEEHAPILLNPGIYQIGSAGVNQVEYDGEEERRVLD